MTIELIGALVGIITLLLAILGGVAQIAFSVGKVQTEQGAQGERIKKLEDAADSQGKTLATVATDVAVLNAIVAREPTAKFRAIGNGQSSR